MWGVRDTKEEIGKDATNRQAGPDYTRVVTSAYEHKNQSHDTVSPNFNPQSSG